MHMKMPKFQLAHLGSAQQSMACLKMKHICDHLTFISFTVCACLVALNLDQCFQGLRVLGGAIGRCGWRSSRHLVVLYCDILKSIHSKWQLRGSRIMLGDSSHVHLDVQDIRLCPGEPNLVQV
jgi:hypothetical protein